MLHARLAVAEAEAAAERRRAREAAAQLDAVAGSLSWRLTRPLRAARARSPHLARWVGRAVKLSWWTLTFQLPARYRLWRQTPPHATALPLPAAATPQPVTEATLATALARIDALEQSAATLEAAGPAEAARLDALEQRMATLGAAAPLQAALARIGAVEGRARLAETALAGERERIDWALGVGEGVPAAIEAYHACRETADYRAAFAAATPLVSVCVATMDRAELLLERSVASIRAQTYRNLQIVVVGDACTDDTAARLAALRDDRIQFVNLPERGPYPRPGLARWYVAGTNALNRALALCEGQFVTHLDDDDAMVPHRIETLAAAALAAKADFLWHPFWYENRDGTWRCIGNGQLERGQVSTGSIFYHRYFARFPWDIGAYRLAEPGDWNRLRRIRLLSPRLRYVDEPLVYHHTEQSQPDFVARDGERFLD